MSALTGSVRYGGPTAPPHSRQPGHGGGRDGRNDAGMLSLEAVLVLPVLALLVIGVLQVAGVVRDVLVLHEAARAGARAAATTSGTAGPAAAARQAAPELAGLTVRVTPAVRRDGDLVRVEVTVRRSIGPVGHTLRASAVSRVEPAVGHGP